MMINSKKIDNGMEPSPEQEAVPNTAADYLGIQLINKNYSWITIQLGYQYRELFNKEVRILEKWHPIFAYSIPTELQDALDLAERDKLYPPHPDGIIDSTHPFPAAPDDSFFNIWFRGTPSEKGRHGYHGLCEREVQIIEVFKTKDFTNPLAKAFSNIRLEQTYKQVLTLMGQPKSESLISPHPDRIHQWQKSGLKVSVESQIRRLEFREQRSEYDYSIQMAIIDEQWRVVHFARHLDFRARF
jgi:hypothetical protein